MLETERCLLYRLGKDDIELYSILHRNQEVRKYLGGIVDEDEIKRKFNLITNSTDLYWKVIEKENNSFIGIVSLDRYHDEVHMELSYEFLPDFWGQGYAYESLTSTIEFAFKVLKVRSLIAETQSANQKSRRLLERLGMELKQEVIRFNEKQSVYILESM